LDPFSDGDNYTDDTSGFGYWRFFDYPNSYVDQTALTLGATWTVAEGVSLLAGGGWVWEQPMTRRAGSNSEHRRDGRDLPSDFSYTIGGLVDLGVVTLSLGYVSGLDRVQLGVGQSF
jgi:hypothetical protein